jgi:hypothetical protein
MERQYLRNELRRRARKKKKKVLLGHFATLDGWLLSWLSGFFLLDTFYGISSTLEPTQTMISQIEFLRL